MASNYEVRAYLIALILVNDSPIPGDIRDMIYSDLVRDAPDDVKIKGDRVYVNARTRISRRHH